MLGAFETRAHIEQTHSDVITSDVMAALEAPAPFDDDRKDMMAGRLARRAARTRNRERIGFLPADATIPRTQISVRDAREGRFVGGEIPTDLQRQWIQGTGPAARPNAPVQVSIRNVA